LLAAAGSRTAEAGRRRRRHESRFAHAAPEETGSSTEWSTCESQILRQTCGGTFLWRRRNRATSFNISKRGLICGPHSREFPCIDIQVTSQPFDFAADRIELLAKVLHAAAVGFQMGEMPRPEASCQPSQAVGSRAQPAAIDDKRPTDQAPQREPESATHKTPARHRLRCSPATNRRRSSCQPD